MREMTRQSQWPQTHCLQCVFTDLWAFLSSFLPVFRWYLSQFSTDFHVIFAGTTCNYSGDCSEKFVKFERVFLKLLVRLVVNLLEYFKIYSFRRQFRHQFSTVYPRNFAGTIGWYYGDCPENYVKFERILQKLLMRLVWNLIEYFKSYLFRRQFRRQFSTVFHVVLQAPSNGIMATALWIL